MQKRHLFTAAAAGVGAIALGVAGFLWWQGKQRFETTDNAYVQADTVNISPQIEGYVAQVLVSDNQRVAPGQVLVRLDPATVQARVAQAEANVAALDAAVRSVDDRARLEEAQIAERAAGVAAAQAEAEQQRLDLRRYDQLASKGWVSDQRLQTARAGAAQTGAAVAQAQAALEAERRSAQSLGSSRAQSAAQAQAARASVQQARIDLDRTEIKAPVAGVVGARAVRVGQYVRPGTALMSVVPLADTYVVANFKETQVARLRLGQKVEITADAFGDEKIEGVVDSFAPATGSEFALIPVENATGNFTKIVQRVPVKIRVARSGPLAGALRPGLSVEIKVDVRDSSGVSFAEAASHAAAPQLADASPAPAGAR